MVSPGRLQTNLVGREKLNKRETADKKRAVLSYTLIRQWKTFEEDLLWSNCFSNNAIQKLLAFCDSKNLFNGSSPCDMAPMLSSIIYMAISLYM